MARDAYFGASKLNRTYHKFYKEVAKVTTQQAIATITGNLRQPVGKSKLPRWAFILAIVGLLAAVAVSLTIRFVMASGSAATAQTQISAAANAPASAPAAPLAQQVSAPAAATSLQTVQLTAAEVTSLQNQLWHIIFSTARRPGNPTTPQAAAQMDQFQRDFNHPAWIREVWIVDSVTQAVNGTARAHLKIQAWDRGTGNRRTPAWNKLVEERRATTEFVLDQNKRITQVTNFQYR